MGDGGAHLSPWPQGAGPSSPLRGLGEQGGSTRQPHQIRPGAVSLSSYWRAADSPPILGLRSRFPVSAGCSHSQALPGEDLFSLALTKPRIITSRATAHTQRALCHRAKSRDPARPPHFCPLHPAPGLQGLPATPPASSCFLPVQV